MLLKNKILTLKDTIIKGKFNCSYKIPNIQENIGFDIYINGMFEADTIHLILGRLPPGAVLIDIGANIGSISLPICKQRNDIKAVCIEASPRVYKYLEFNKEYNQAKNCITVNRAMSDTDGKTVNFYSPVEKFGKGSMSSVYTKNAETIETITLDTLLQQKKIDKIDFIKVDIEGYEYFAFKGARQILSSTEAPDILFEFMDWAEVSAHARAGDAQQILLEYGYKLFIITKDKKQTALYTPLTKGDAMILATKK